MAVMQSYTDDTKANFVIINKNEKSQCYAIAQNKTNPSKIKPTHEVFSFEESEYFVHHCNFSELSKASEYQLLITDNNENKLDEREFKTLDPAKLEFKFALISCMNDLFHIPIIWDNLTSHNPDYIFMIGDNIYADFFKDFVKIDKKHLSYRYIHSWLVYKLFQKKHLTPVLALWDDHDYGENNSDSTYANKETSKKLFSIFYNQDHETNYIKQGPGISFTFSWQKDHFIFLDDRYFRNPNQDKDGDYFSNEQIEWLKNTMELNKNDYFWIISGNQWFSSPIQDESFENNHPKALINFFKAIHFQKYKTLLLSGDAHLSEVKKINVQNEKLIFEITSSGMHAFPMSDMGNDNRRLAGTNLPNFMILDLKRDQVHTVGVSDYTIFDFNTFQLEVGFL